MLPETGTSAKRTRCGSQGFRFLETGALILSLVFRV
jgi:hypothetical protein